MSKVYSSAEFVPHPVSPETAALTAYLASALHSELPEDVVVKAAHHLLDTVAAVVSGARMAPGRRGFEIASGLGGYQEATIIATPGRTTEVGAALANGMAAHADETDDSHAPTLSHPGCGIVPAALAVAEAHGRSGNDLIRAITAGYDVGCRVGRAVGLEALDLRLSTRSSHALVGTFGAGAAAAALYRLSARQCGHVLSYSAQQAGGVTSWMRDLNHVEKAYVFAGQPASQGVLAARMVAGGSDGVDDVFSGHPNFLDATGPNPRRSELSDELGKRFEVAETNIKRYSVGSPAQAAVQAAEDLVVQHGRPFAADELAGIEVRLSSDMARVVDNRSMADINVQYLVAATLLDGSCTFVLAHDAARLRDATIQQLIARTELIPDDTLLGGRKAILTLALSGDGGSVSQRVDSVRGTVTNPMAEGEVRAKAEDLMAPVLGASRTALLCDQLLDPSSVRNVRELAALLVAD
jgi:2-methylcitrate dehydratase PrpD